MPMDMDLGFRQKRCVVDFVGWSDKQGVRQYIDDEAKLSEMFLAEFFKMFQCWMYARIGSPDFFTHALTSSVDAGRL